MQTIKSRNEASHTYNEEIAQKIHLEIIEKYYDAFLELKNALQKQYDKRVN